MSCSHRTPTREVWEEVEVGLYGETEMQYVTVGGESTEVDMDIGRFRCTQCGKIGYYTGTWRNHYENNGEKK